MFRSMYDEPRRRNNNKHLDSEENIKSSFVSKSEKINEMLSASGTDTGDESSHENEDKKDFNANKNLSDILMKEADFADENFMKKLVWLEHNYFTVPPSPVQQQMSRPLKHKAFKDNVTLNDELEKFPMRLYFLYLLLMKTC